MTPRKSLIISLVVAALVSPPAIHSFFAGNGMGRYPHYPWDPYPWFTYLSPGLIAGLHVTGWFWRYGIRVFWVTAFSVNLLVYWFALYCGSQLLRWLVRAARLRHPAEHT